MESSSYLYELRESGRMLELMSKVARVAQLHSKYNQYILVSWKTGVSCCQFNVALELYIFVSH